MATSKKEMSPELAQFLTALMTKKDLSIFDMYREWTLKYDDVILSLDKNPAQLFAQEFQTLVPNKEARILDVGCGNGQLGRALRQLDYQHVDGLDGCKDFYENSLKKGNFYDKFVECVVTPEDLIPVESHSYDALLMCDSFYSDHITGDCLPQLIRLIKPGGIIGWSRCYYLSEPWLYFNMPAEKYENVINKLHTENRVGYVPGYFPKVLDTIEGTLESQVCFLKVT